MKICFKCGEGKPLSEFYRHKQMADGHLNKCKSCSRKDVKENREKNIDYYREYDVKRGNRQGYDYVRNYRNEFPMKYAAHTLIGNRVRDGKIKRPEACESCGCSSDSMHAHHDDYALPLLVRWLCPPCHSNWHKENGEGKNAK